ncbi:hypothetical protein B0H15DRAFT_159301 [Mycena belliarum]|uniref:F-box domain-containing protein n=1 Tax=Mycena belliarum TaxID=1033014 RepID=A0AAD6U902_9AGAR|nr:hypothetical protein B0H15DRAFT_159301 [Mycena belliae]
MTLTASSLPPEIWMYIQRLATLETSPLTLAYADRFQYVPLADPLKDLQGFLRAACSFVLVCRLWNSLATEILYENVRVDKRFPMLRATLERRGAGRLVRSIRLSPIHDEYNYQILALCPLVQLIVQPDHSTTQTRRWEFADIPGLSRLPALPELLALRHVYCSELLIDSYLLTVVLETSPNIEYLSVTRITFTPPNDPYALAVGELPAIANLKRLAFPPLLRRAMPSSLFWMNLQGLTRLQCSPTNLALEEFPTLPSLRVLEIFGSRSIILFPVIFSRCPRLHELCYDVWNRISPPNAARSSLSVIRLHSAVTVVRDWTTIETHFRLFLDPGFPALRQLVLHGSWHRVVADLKFPSRFPHRLRERGCRFEFPEGNVLNRI